MVSFIYLNVCYCSLNSLQIRSNQRITLKMCMDPLSAQVTVKLYTTELMQYGMVSQNSVMYQLVLEQPMSTTSQDITMK